MIRGIIFDYFGVLCHGSLEYLRSITPPDRLQDLNDLSHSFDYGYISHEEYIERVSELVELPGKNVEMLMRQQYVRNESALRLIRSLRSVFKIGMLSNIGRGVINELFSQQELANLFDAVVLSSEVGIVKPDERVYSLMASRLGILSEECVMIDDSQRNIDGAERSGMKVIRYVSEAQLEKEIENLKKGQNA